MFMHETLALMIGEVQSKCLLVIPHVTTRATSCEYDENF